MAPSGSVAVTVTRAVELWGDDDRSARPDSCQGDLGDGVVPGLCDPDGLPRAGGDAVEVAVRCGQAQGGHAAVRSHAADGPVLLAEPHGAVRPGGDVAQAAVGHAHVEQRDLTVRAHLADLAGAEVGEPDGRRPGARNTSAP